MSSFVLVAYNLCSWSDCFAQQLFAPDMWGLCFSLKMGGLLNNVRRMFNIGYLVSSLAYLACIAVFFFQVIITTIITLFLIKQKLTNQHNCCHPGVPLTLELSRTYKNSHNCGGGQTSRFWLSHQLEDLPQTRIEQHRTSTTWIRQLSYLCFGCEQV